MKPLFYHIQNAVLTLLVSLALWLIVIAVSNHIGFMSRINWKIYDILTRIEYNIARRPAADGVVLITIDNDTLAAVHERWPFSRSKFAAVVNNLRGAGVRAIGFDFIFYGRSTPEEDASLDTAIKEAGNVVLAAAIDEEGKLRASAPFGASASATGLVTKLQESDGITRREFTYLTRDDGNAGVVLSWSLGLLGTARKDLLCGLRAGNGVVECREAGGGIWKIPVDDYSKAYLIRFHGRTSDYKRVSFYNILKGDFDRAAMKDKVAIIGLTSSIFGDFHNTPIGWMPGVVLNANAFSTLYKRDFLTMMPKALSMSLALAALFAASILISLFGFKKTSIFIIPAAVLFFMVSYFILTKGYVWNYIRFPVALALIPVLSKKIVDLILHIWFTIILRKGIWIWKLRN